MQFFSRSLDWQSPLKIFSDIDREEKFSQLLYSGTSAGRFSFIPFSPEEIFSLSGDTDDINDDRNKKNKYNEIKKKFLVYQKKYSKKNIPKTWKYPFCGGIVGVFSYDAARIFEDIPENISMDRKFPLGKFGLYTNFFAFDHQKKNFSIAGWFENQEDSEIFFDNLTSNILSLPGAIASSSLLAMTDVNFSPEISYKQYIKKFSQCQDQIEKGNSFQINFSQKFSLSLASLPKEISSWEIFLKATKKNPAPMMYFCSFSPLLEGGWGGEESSFSLISCSPERLFSIDTNNKIFTQPIAGTRPRGKNSQQDLELENELKNSKKEISEHSMIVDLLRNDMGRVSKFGCVCVSEFARVEKYKTVMHLVSDIIGEKPEKISVFDIFEAFFPGGTITGAPKIETMKILAKLETSSRNFYCGSAGYFSFCGSADWNILIRTLERQGEKISARAGGGLIYGTNADQEYEEILHKFSGIEKIFLEE